MKTYLTEQMKDELIDILQLHQGYFGTEVEHLMKALNNEPTSLDVKKQSDIIIASVSSLTGVSVDDIRSPKRTRNITIARQYAIYEVYEQLYIHGLSLSQIGKMFNRDHSTVLYSVRTVSDAIKLKDPLISRLHEMYNQ